MDRTSSLTPALVLIAAASATGVAGCGTDTEDVYYTCVDENGNVVDQDYCDNDNDHGGGGYYFFSSNTYYHPGTRAPSGWQSSRFRPNDTAARQRIGLPPTGKVPGKVTVGGFGKGGTSSSSGG